MTTATSVSPRHRSLLQATRDDAEQKAIALALQETRWNRRAAARLLEISYRGLLYKIEQYGLSPDGAERGRKPGTADPNRVAETAAEIDGAGI
jgi:DNA-binding NtrC family response regulator